MGPPWVGVKSADRSGHALITDPGVTATDEVAWTITVWTSAPRGAGIAHAATAVGAVSDSPPCLNRPSGGTSGAVTVPGIAPPTFVTVHHPCRAASCAAARGAMRKGAMQTPSRARRIIVHP